MSLSCKRVKLATAFFGVVSYELELNMPGLIEQFGRITFKLLLVVSGF